MFFLRIFYLKLQKILVPLDENGNPSIVIFSYDKCEKILSLIRFIFSFFRFNYLTKPLPTQLVAKKIMHSILVNQKNVCIPRVLYLLAVAKSILPTRAFFLLVNFILQPSRPNLEVYNSSY